MGIHGPNRPHSFNEKRRGAYSGEHSKRCRIPRFNDNQNRRAGAGVLGMSNKRRRADKAQKLAPEENEAYAMERERAIAAGEIEVLRPIRRASRVPILGVMLAASLAAKL